VTDVERSAGDCLRPSARCKEAFYFLELPTMQESSVRAPVRAGVRAAASPL
jgi:hypothetical protein